MAAIGVATEIRTWLADEIAAAIHAAASEMGLGARPVRGGDDERSVETVIAVGHPWMYPDLARRRRAARRILWYGEWLPPDGGAARTDPSWTTALPSGRRIDAASRWLLNRTLAMAATAGLPAIERRVLSLKERAAMAREGTRHLAELAAGAGPFDVVAVTSHDKAAGAARAGVAARVVPFGYHQVLSGSLIDPADGRRDIPVVFFGALATRGFRRGRLLEALERTAPFPIAVVREGLHGAARHALLRRARVVVDIHRIPGNLAMLRWFHAAAAGAALVTEPFLDPRPLVPGVHYLASEPSDFAPTLAALLDDEARRRAIVGASQALMRDRLHMAASIRALLAAAGS
jgi:hypothetical protein